MQTKVLSAPSGCLLWRCLFSWQRNGAGGIGKTVRNSKPVDHSNLTTKHVSAPAQCHTRHLQHPLTPPRAAGLNRVRTRVRSLQQAPSRQAARCSAAEAPAAGSPGPAGSPQAARRHVRAAVSDLDCSLPAPRRPSGSGSAGAMSRVGGALREQRGGGCVRLDERRASRAACLSCGLCAQLTWASRYFCTMRAGELGRRKITGR